MWEEGGKIRRRSFRICLNRAYNASLEEINYSKNKGSTATENTCKQSQSNSTRKIQKRKRLSQISNPTNPKIEEEPENYEDPPPSKRILDSAVHILQRLDPDDYFGNPVDPNEVKYYYEHIKEPMDFGTVKAKIRDGGYKNLRQFEYDINLISQNAMKFNGVRTVYYKKARSIKELAMKVMDQLQNNPNELENAFPQKGTKNGCSGACTSGSKSSTKSQKKQTHSGDPNIEIHDNTRITFSTSIPLVSTVYRSTKQLVPINGGMGYKESLTRFLRGLGPTAAKVAAPKLARCFTEPKPPRPPSHQFIQQQQLYRSLTCQQPQGPTEPKPPRPPLFVNQDSCIPRKPTGIVIGLNAPPVTRGPITPSIGATDKGKGILIDDKGIPGGTFSQTRMGQSQPAEQNDLLLQVYKSQLHNRFNHPVVGPTYPVPPARQNYRPNTSLLDLVSSWQNNRPIQTVYPSRVVTPSRSSQTQWGPQPVNRGGWHDGAAGPSNLVRSGTHQGLHYRSAGNNQVGQGAQDWEAQVRLLSSEYRIVENQPPIVYFRRRHHEGNGGPATQQRQFNYIS